MLTRLLGVTGVVQLAEEAVSWPGSLVLVDVGAENLAGVAMPLPVDEVVELAVGLARAVAGMHARAVLHRNICPANIVLDGDRVPCLVDFGLATAVSEIRPDFTHASQIVGELVYLAPEQTGRTGRVVDERGDLYALGVTLYELATGAPPFPSGDPLRLLHDHLTRVPVAPAVVNPAVPGPLSEVIMHLLEKEPDHRYQTADGLAYDLQRLREVADRPVAGRSVGVDGSGSPFRVGERDVPLRLVSPSRLVGRDVQVAALEAAFEDALEGRCQGVLVSGVSGVGKTALIDQLRPVVTGSDGWFVSGKFDQYRRDLEFDGVHQAIRALVRLLLAEPEDELVEVRERILRALGPNAGLMTAGSPEFVALLGVPPDPGDPLTAQARAQWAGVQVLRAVASRKRPVLLFVDDLQWAGRTPVGFVDLVLRGEPVEGLLLVGAYRDSAVDTAHPLAASLARWRGQAGVRQVRLSELPVSEMAVLVAEMLHLEPVAAAGLAGLITPSVAGNPYESVELLNALRQGGVLVPTARGWRWDEAAVRAYLDVADPARLSAGRIEALPAPSRRLVEAMACLGGRVEPGLLATVTGAPAGEVERDVVPAVGEGLLVAEPGSRAAVRFRHDRIREAVLAGLDVERRRGLHLAMARRLAEVPAMFAVAAEQYLPVVDAVTDVAERHRVVALLRRAADQAALIGEYALVSGLLGAAVRLIAPGDSATLVAVRAARHAALYGAGRLDEADEEYRAIGGLAPTAAQRADTVAVQVRSLTHRDRFAEAITLGVRTLRRLGIAVPATDRVGEDLDRQFGHLHRWLERGDITDELTRPEITDPTLLATARLLNANLSVAYHGDYAMFVWLSLEAVRIWLDHGPAPTLIGPAATAAFSAVTMRGDEAARWFRALRRFLAVGETRGFEPGTSQVHFLYGVSAWQFEPIENGVDAARRAQEGLRAGGERANAAYAYHAAVCYLLDCSPSLVTVAAEVQVGLDFARRTGNEQTSELLEGHGWLAGALLGDSFAAAPPPAIERYAGHSMALLHAYVTRALAAALFGDLTGLVRHTAAAMTLLPAVQGLYIRIAVWPLRGLALAEQARTADADERAGLLTELDEVIGWLAAHAVDAPANFSHLVRLLEAERAWAVGDFHTAGLAFDTALREVAHRRRPWHKALIAEHAAKFYLAHGFDHVGHQLLAQARQAYAAWGATAKVAQIDWAHPTPRTDADTTEPSIDQPTNPATPVTSGTIDLLGILSASQAISSETSATRLHTRVADVLGAMTGATSVRLLLYNDEHHDWLAPVPGGAIPIGGGHETTAPMTVLRYVHRSGEPVIVADAGADDRFARDPYFTDATGCSLLAVPILSRGTLRAVLLLENRLIRGAFTTGRLDAVTLIAGQLAVSLDNAQLYADLTASRQRIVTTADHTRRRIERDLHDGAQQRLVSLAMQLSAARAERDLDELHARLDSAGAEAAAAIEELREIAHGIHPSVLTTGGLRPALRALARRAPIPVYVHAHTSRLPEPVEISAYYTVAEALTNAAKHANATSVDVTLEATDTMLYLTIRDDGVGGADLSQGTGILGLKDRVEALGGRIRLDSPPGMGTTMHAQIPFTMAGLPVD